MARYRISPLAARVAAEVTGRPFPRFPPIVTRDDARLDAYAPAEARPLLDALLLPDPTGSHLC